ncbi:MAG: hypothetical protein ACE5D3_01085 [Candidatus Binatia bacterium]
MTIKQQVKVFEERITKATRARDKLLSKLARPETTEFERKCAEIEIRKYALQIRTNAARLRHYKKPS